MRQEALAQAAQAVTGVRESRGLPAKAMRVALDQVVGHQHAGSVVVAADDGPASRAVRRSRRRAAGLGGGLQQRPLTPERAGEDEPSTRRSRIQAATVVAS
jgi:hypothetical protein